MAHLPPHSLFLLFLAVHVFAACHGSPLPPSSTYDDSICSESFKCGSVDIRYPFYLSNATGVTSDYTSHYSCGYTDLKIFCQVEGRIETPILQLGQHELHNYTVLNILYDKYTIILGDTEALNSGKCPAVTHNVTFSHEWLNYTDLSSKLTFFYGCSSLPDVEEYRINCEGFNPPAGSADGVSLVLTSEEDNISRDYELAEHCSRIVVVPVHEDVLLRIGEPALPREYGAVLEHGFPLEWKQRTEQACDHCEESKGRCAYSEKKQFIGCLCYGGKVGAPVCNSTGATAEYPNPPSG